jgi:hypothetical protein
LVQDQGRLSVSNNKPAGASDPETLSGIEA